MPMFIFMPGNKILFTYVETGQQSYTIYTKHDHHPVCIYSIYERFSKCEERINRIKYCNVAQICRCAKNSQPSRLCYSVCLLSVIYVLRLNGASY